MNLLQLQHDLKRDEDVKYEIYLDNLGYPTLGVGHLIRPKDPEFGKPVGTPVSETAVNQYFLKDLYVAIQDCENLFPNLKNLPEVAQHVLINMTFNMGKTRFSKFKNMRAAVANQDWRQVAIEMRNSLWYKQVKSRSKRLVAQIETLIV